MQLATEPLEVDRKGISNTPFIIVTPDVNKNDDVLPDPMWLGSLQKHEYVLKN